MITKWTLLASVRSDMLVTGISEEAKKKTAVRVMLLGSAARAGMLQLDPATWGQASNGVNSLGTSFQRLVGLALMHLPSAVEPPPRCRQPGSPAAASQPCAVGGHVPAATEA